MSLRSWHDTTWATLSTALANGRLHHALLISGPRGLGKLDLANALLAAALCQQRGADQQACGRCRSCSLLAAGSHPDRIHVTLEPRDDGKLRSEITIDQIRALSQRLALSSQYGGLQLALIEPAELLNTNAANALLKTLEEPTPATVMLLVCNDASRLPATIRSRCQRIDIRIPDRDQALAWLAEQGIDAKSAAAALDVCQGNPGAALQLLEEGGLDLREQCARDLGLLASGAMTALAVADAWVADHPQRRVWLAASVALDEARRLGRGESSRFGLTGATEIQKLATWFGHANRVRRLLETTLRADLLLLDLLRDWPTTNRGMR